MDLIHVVLVLVVIGVLLWLINTYFPMAGTIKVILNVFVVIAVVWWIMAGFGMARPFPNLHIGKFHLR